MTRACPVGRCISIGRLVAYGESEVKSNLAQTKLRRSRPSAIASNVNAQTDSNDQDPSTAEVARKRMIADTAHDLRSPLTGIRELIRMVADDSGALPDDHSDFLATAIDQCDVMQSIIEGLLVSETVSTGSPVAHRSWVKAKALCQHLQRMIQATLPNDADVYWDCELVGEREVYCDTTLIQRLIGNLVNNAIKAATSGTPILVRVVPDHDSMMLRFAVMDQGPGLSPPELQRVARRHVSHQGGHGLGLSICSSIAAAHYSTLEMSSIRGTGTEVSLELPAAGPASLAEAWCKWRLEHPSLDASAKQTFCTRQLPGVVESASLGRIDPADNVSSKRISSPNRITIDDTSQRPRAVDHVIAGTLTIGAAHPISAVDDFDKFLQSQISAFDLSLRINARKWVWVFDTPVNQVESRLRSFVQDAQKHIAKPRLNWSDPQMISLNDRCFKARITDILIRETLQARANEHMQDNNQVRMGTKPISMSPVAAARLDDELTRLTSRFKEQSVRLREHAKKMQGPNTRS